MVVLTPYRRSIGTKSDECSPEMSRELILKWKCATIGISESQKKDTDHTSHDVESRAVTRPWSPSCCGKSSCMGIQSCTTERGRRASQLSMEAKSDETARLHAVLALGCPRMPSLQSLCDEVCSHFGASDAFINLVGEERVRVTVSTGTMDWIEMERGKSICTHVIHNPDQRQGTSGVLVVADVASEFPDTVLPDGFYAGVPIWYSNSEGPEQPVGTLCIFDRNGRVSFSSEQCNQLREYGEKVTALLASPLPSLLGDNGGDHHLHSIDERVAVLMVSCGV